ncbi:hypothetical protein KFK09_003859 [Dendrobium nobile]|uniref:Uncharacterized protein n=1 Tax=Dendrobium nobile TaxID=94219 RepID=A0A8T3C4M9_DENNO|nr:hypothetical protein KFK09_003859 [Dendrobium nobile]
MEASRERKGGDEVLSRRLHTVYFLSKKGNIGQPHFIKVDQLNNDGVHLQDSLELSIRRQKRIEKQSLVMVEMEASRERKGRDKVFLFSPIKIFEKLKEEAKSLASPATLRTPCETLQREKTSCSNPPTELEEQSPVETLNSSSEEAQWKIVIFKIESWKEEMKIVEKVCCEEMVPIENGRQDAEVKSKKIGDNKAGSWAPFILRDF